MAAERETADRLIAHFLAEKVGAIFDGHIGGVTRAGLFVKLDDTGADGFIPARTLGNDYFRYSEAAHALVGEATGETHRLGDPVKVRLVEAVPIAGALRFELLSEGRFEPRARKRYPGARHPTGRARTHVGQRQPRRRFR
jgi:ribonuclease R